MKRDLRLLAGAAFGLLLSLSSVGIGVWLGAIHTAEDLDMFTLSLLSVIGSWLSGVATLVAVVVALYIANKQLRTTYLYDSVRVMHHAMMVVNDLRGRLLYFRTTLVEGGRPLVALTNNASMISKRYESLFDRDLCKVLPGPVIDKISGMSGSFFGIEAMTTYVASSLRNELHTMLGTPLIDIEVQKASVSSLLAELDELFSMLQHERSLLEERKAR